MNVGQTMGLSGLRRMAAAALLLVPAARAAVLGTDTFGSNPNVGDRDPDEMAVSYNGTIGAGSMQGFFASQDQSSPDSDAFRITSSSSGGSFTGDYWTDVPTFASWSFSFYADNVLASDMIVRFNGDGNTFAYSVFNQVSSIDHWYTVTVPLTYAGWVGGSGLQFTNALGGVTFIDVQITRNGTGAQTYYLDNFSLNGPSESGGGSGGAVPEPSTAGLLLASVAVLRATRKRGSRVRQALGSLWRSEETRRGPAGADQLDAPAAAQPLLGFGSSRKTSRRKLQKKRIQLIF